MRIGLLSDIHGNLFALRSTLAALRRAGTDLLVCAGDLVGYGPHPNECVETVAEMEIPTVAGNHDLMAVGTLSDERCVPLARASQQWTRRVLRADVRTYLSELPITLMLGPLVVAHGSLGDPQRYVLSRAQASKQLAYLAQYHRGSFLLLGHTHQPWVYAGQDRTVWIRSRSPAFLSPSAPYLLNPGSVGQSRSRERSPRARCMVLDLERRTVELHVVSYDIEACREALRRRALPRESVHAPPRVTVRARRAAKRKFRALGSGGR